MTLSDYWRVIELSRESFIVGEGAMKAQAELITLGLRNFDIHDLTEFDAFSKSLLVESYNWDIVGAAVLLAGFCSDDLVVDFIGWLISMGKNTYENAVRDPNSLAVFVGDPSIESFFFEDFFSLPSKVAGFELNSEWVFPQRIGGIPFADNRDLSVRLPGLDQAVNGRSKK